MAHWIGIMFQREPMFFTWTPRMPNMIKKAQLMRTMFPIGFREVIKVSTTSLSPGARLITLLKLKKLKKFHLQSCKPSIRWTTPQKWLQLLAVPEGAQCAEKPENPQGLQDLSPTRHWRNNVSQRHQHQETIQNVPAAAQVCLLSKKQTLGHHLQ